MASILVIYSTTDGHTLTICERMRSVMAAAGHAVTLVPIADAVTVDPARFDRVLIGASIRYGFHAREVTDFIRRHADTLARLPSAFFSVNLVARKPDRRRADTNPYVRRFLKRIPWKPATVGVFGGRLDYPAYAPLDRWVIRLIMTITGGPTDPATTVEFTDWDAVDAFARDFAG